MSIVQTETESKAQKKKIVIVSKHPPVENVYGTVSKFDYETVELTGDFTISGNHNSPLFFITDNKEDKTHKFLKSETFLVLNNLEHPPDLQLELYSLGVNIILCVLEIKKMESVFESAVHTVVLFKDLFLIRNVVRIDKDIAIETQRWT